MRLTAHGLRSDLPDGWEGVIARRHDRGDGNRGGDPDRVPQGRVPGRVLPTLHAGNFALPRSRGDYGSGVTHRMTSRDAFVALVEFGTDEADSPLFTGACPRRLALRDFHQRTLQRALPGQVGSQCFFNEGGRAFSLYVVLGGRPRRRTDARTRHSRLPRLVEEVNGVLDGLRIVAAE